MVAPSIERLAHVGIHVNDVEKSIIFYRDILGLKVSDEDREAGLIFMSSHPDEEHHELLLLSGRNVSVDARLLQQISFRCLTLTDVIEYWKRFVAHDVKIIYTITHGNAISCYFKDPDENICEVYWPTGLKARQGFLIGLDFNDSEEKIMKQVTDLVKEHGETGIIDFKLLAEQNV
jgi:catechol 2,3-dioxygenase-like lactoylglutathione lyase family enzyme